jgi:WD40 repeat protein
VGPTAQPDIEIWDVAAKTRTQTLTGPADRVTAVSFQPGGSLIAASSQDGSLRIWDVESGLSVRQTSAEPSQGWFTGVDFSPDGTMLVTGALNGSVQIWDVGAGSEIAQYIVPGGVVTLGFRPDGDMLVVSSRDGVVRLFTRPAS